MTKSTNVQTIDSHYISDEFGHRICQKKSEIIR